MTRKVFIPVSRQGDMYAGLLLYVVSSLALAWVINELMRHIPNPTLRRSKVVDISQGTDRNKRP